MMMNKINSLSSIHRRWPLFTLAMILALALALLLTVIGYAGLSSHSQRTAFQLQSLDNNPVDFTAHFRYFNGQDAYSISDTVPPGCGFHHEPNLPGNFTGGRLYIETDQNLAAVNTHFGPDGNDVFETVSDETTTSTTYFAPHVEWHADVFSNTIMVGNLGTQATGVSIILVESLTGEVLPPYELPGEVPANGSVPVNLRQALDRDDFAGSATVYEAGQPLFVDVVQTRAAQMAVYPAFPDDEPAKVLYAPHVADYEAKTVTPTISVQNIGAEDATVFVNPSGQSFTLQPGESAVATITSGAGPYVVTSNEPLAAVVGTESVEGASAYAALRPSWASHNLYAPLLFNDHEGWTTALWVYNPDPGRAATVTVTYVELANLADVTATQSVNIAPGAAVPFIPPSTVRQSVAHVRASLPVMGVVEGKRTFGNDRLFAYRTTPSDFQAQLPVSAQLLCAGERIPTLTQWGYIILAVVMVFVAVWTMRRARVPEVQRT
jgi:hypothetical protein